MFTQVIVLATLLLAANALPCLSCVRASLSYAVSRSAETQYVIGTPIQSTRKEYQTSTAEVAIGFEIRDAKWLNKVSDTGSRPTTFVAVYSQQWDSTCGYKSQPFKWGEKQVFALSAVPFQLKDQPTTIEPPVSAPPALPSQAPSCALKEGSITEGRCLNTCNAPYQSFAWSSGLVNDGCRRFPKGITCCTLPANYTPPKQAQGQELLAFFMPNCGNAVKKACASGEGCLSTKEVTALINSDLALTDSDITGISTFKCEGKCENGGRCVNNKCICDSPWGGSRCTDTLPFCSETVTENCLQKLEVKNFVPGGSGNDIWMFGARRTIEFDISGYESTSLVKSLDVYIVNEDEYAGCGGVSVAFSKFSILERYWSKKVGSVRLSASSTKGSVTTTLSADDDCVQAGSSYRIVVKEMPEGNVWKGPLFSTANAGCAASGAVGVCAPSCNSGWSAVSSSNCAQSKCCVPKALSSEQQSAGYLSWFTFNVDGSTPVFAGSTIDVHWDHHEARSKFGFNCNLDEKSEFTLQLVQLHLVTATVVGEYGKFSVESAKASSITIKSTTRHALNAGDYKFVAKFSPGCTYSSDSFSVRNTGCMNTNTKTVIGECTLGDCIDSIDSDARLCAGISGGKCCFKPRTGMSPSFRDEGSDGFAPSSATSVSFTALALIVALIAALF